MSNPSSFSHCQYHTILSFASLWTILYFLCIYYVETACLLVLENGNKSLICLMFSGWNGQDVKATSRNHKKLQNGSFRVKLGRSFHYSLFCTKHTNYSRLSLMISGAELTFSFLLEVWCFLKLWNQHILKSLWYPVHIILDGKSLHWHVSEIISVFKCQIHVMRYKH